LILVEVSELNRFNNCANGLRGKGQKPPERVGFGDFWTDWGGDARYRVFTNENWPSGPFYFILVRYWKIGYQVGSITRLENPNNP